MAIFVISLETIKCLITLVFFLSQNSLLITNHNFKDRRAGTGGGGASLSDSSTYLIADFSLAWW